MIEIYMNGENINAELENEKTVGDVLLSFEQTCEENKAAVIGIKINGKQIDSESFDQESAKELGQNDKFEFTVVTENNIKESFKNLAQLFEVLSSNMEEIPGKLQNNQKKEVSETINKLADSVDQFSHIAALASLFPETFSQKDIDGKNLKEFFSDFSSILLDFENALKNDDTVLIGDLAEYEICPRLKSISESLKTF
ncbi:MAG: hypothetical protein K5866_05100 [Treponema sp.]|nr:hypothetical protein [Treponema sp.]